MRRHRRREKKRRSTCAKRQSEIARRDDQYFMRKYEGDNESIFGGPSARSNINMQRYEERHRAGVISQS